MLCFFFNVCIYYGCNCVHYLLQVYDVLCFIVLQMYHVLCFTCLLCNKKLDSGLLTEKDGDIFCKGTSCPVKL